MRLALLPVPQVKRWQPHMFPLILYGAAIYALQAIYRATNSSDADAAVAKEREWQYQHLLNLGNNHKP